MEKPRVILVLEIGIVIFMMFLFGMDIYRLDPTNDQYAPLYTRFMQSKPAVYRVLVPFLARGVMATISVSSSLALALIASLSGVGAFLTMHILFSIYNLRHLAIYCFLLTASLLYNHASPIDWMTVLLFCLSYYFLARYKFDYYYILFPLMVLHRETAVLLILLYGLFGFRHYFEQHQLHHWINGIAYQLFAFGILRFLLIQAFPNAPGLSSYIWVYDVVGAYISNPLFIFVLIVMILIITILANAWYRLPYFIRSALVLFPIQIILHLMVGNPYELRVIVESFPILFLSLAIALSRENHKKELEQAISYPSNPVAR